MTYNPTKDKVWIKDENVQDIFALAKYFYGGTDIDSFAQILDKIIVAGIEDFKARIEIAEARNERSE